MNLPEKCQELFLKDIIEVSVYSASDCSFLLPFNIPFIAQLNNVSLPTADKRLLLVTKNETDFENATINQPVCYTSGDITAKQTHANNGQTTIFTYDISCNVEQGITPLKAALPLLQKKDNIVVIKNIDEDFYLLYTSPGTFSVSVSDTNMQSATLKIGTKALSDYIPLTLKV